MANLFGTGINQVPTNGMLGNLAFQDKAYVNVDAIGIGTTFVDSGTVGQVLQVSGGAYVSGNLGIGTTNPSSTLTNFGSFATGLTANTLSVTNDSDGIVRIGNSIVTSSTGTGRLNIQDRFGTYLSLYYGTGLVGRLNAPSSSDIALEVGGTERLRILGASGNLGIGTTNPTQTLDVRGNLRVTGTIQNPSMIAFSVAFS